jgi:hypothetical protein
MRARSRRLRLWSWPLEAPVVHSREVEGVDMFGVWSSGQFFPIIPVAELEG